MRILNDEEMKGILVQYACAICESNPIKEWNHTEVIQKVAKAQHQLDLKWIVDLDAQYKDTVEADVHFRSFLRQSLKQLGEVEVMCTYCQKIVSVSKDVADGLDDSTAFCCRECANPNQGQLVEVKGKKAPIRFPCENPY